MDALFLFVSEKLANDLNLACFAKYTIGLRRTAEHAKTFDSDKGLTRNV